MRCCGFCTGDVSPVVTDHGDTDQSAAADRHGDEEGQPVGAAVCKRPEEENGALTQVYIHLINT